MASSEEEIYSTMFSSLKHPVRRKILRMLADKPMAFTEMAELLGVSTSHLTYHLENLGELIFKMEDGRYRLSSFGSATITAMRGVEESPVLESKRRLRLPFKWKATLAGLLIAVILLSSISTLQFSWLSEMESLRSENQQLLSWGVSTNKFITLLQNVGQIDTSRYSVKLLDSTVEYLSDFNVAEEITKYSLYSGQNKLDVSFQFRDNHFYRYQLRLNEDSQIDTILHASDSLQFAKDVLEGYKVYSGDTYIDGMSSLLSQVSDIKNTTVTEGNLKLKITVTGDIELMWMHTTQGIDFSAKSLRMTFTNKVLSFMTDSYYLFTVGSTDISISQERVIEIAKDYAETLTWTIDGQQVTGFATLDPPVSVELLPHSRPKSVALIPYWYVTLRLEQTYSGDINQIAIGVFADNGEVVNVQMLSQ